MNRAQPKRAAPKPHKRSQRPLRSRKLSTTAVSTPHFKPFGGLAELNASTRQLHHPEPQNINVSQDEITKLTKLAYLAPPQSADEVQQISANVNKMVNWLSSITSVNTDTLPHLSSYRNVTQSAQKTTQRLYSNDPSPIPFYTPHILLPQFVPPQALAHLSGSQSATEPTTTPDCVLRMRPDLAQQCELTAVLSNATHSERSFYVAPKFAGGDD